MGKYNSAKQFIGQIFGGKVSPTITKVKPAKNLTTKRTIQDETVKAVDEGIKKADTPQSFKESQKIKQYASETKRKKSKELKDYSYRLDKLTEKKATGGRVGRKFGNPKPKKNIDKIKKAFAPKSKIKFDAKKSDLDKSGSLSPYEKRRGMAIAKAMAKRKKKI
jgi:hypothetical protein